ncbi:aldo/keto reductase [Demetria terragena]|uniref:aldo/keto reductase n=1 Tax=Demetria terragena TaxID=63959 RepID=UPI0003620F74|nr:aldo/keto reductase [Demetria terragena]
MAETNTNVPLVDLRTGSGTTPLPQLGFGVWQVPDEGASDAVQAALTAGYRSIDTAAIYGNEAGVGAALAATDVPRDEIFLTTKVWNDNQGREKTLAAMETSLEKLGLDQVDLYLIHWPTPAHDTYVETWKALLELRDAGKARAVGVCNFEPEHLQRLLDETGELPAINQIELHPRLQQRELREFHAKHEILTEAWSPLGQGGDILKDPVIVEIAERVGRTPAQVILRWHLQIGNVVIPKSVTPSRIAENFDVFDFELTDADLAAIEQLDSGDRLGPNPNEMN